MSPLKIILTLAVSGLIGYFTNYIAVKMLFRPRTEKHIFGKRVPFTPGVVPKNQPRLAKALGRTVSEQLLTGDDLKQALTSEKTADTVAQKITEALFTDRQISDLTADFAGTENAAALRAFAEEKITSLAVQKLKEADIGALIINEGTAAVKEKVAGSMLAMFVNDELIASLAAPLGEKITAYIDSNADGMIGKAVTEELDRLEASTPADLLAGAGVAPETVRAAASQLFMRAAADAIDPLLASVDIPAMVEARVNAMSVVEVEELVMSVMKHELNAVINLGALIGIVIGLLNLLVQSI
ncbi:MAG: DUF445 family protein [Ruminococcus sp.]|nr:DUF445 family protein [Ruminococcus sp.]